VLPAVFETTDGEKQAFLMVTRKLSNYDTVLKIGCEVSKMCDNVAHFFPESFTKMDRIA